jgi:hypothetical protein
MEDSITFKMSHLNHVKKRQLIFIFIEIAFLIIVLFIINFIFILIYIILNKSKYIIIGTYSFNILSKAKLRH